MTGISNGGAAAWELAMRYPERFAAVAPLASPGGDASRAALLKDVPVWAFHNQQDAEVSIAGDRTMVAAINQAGGRAFLTELDRGGHDAWIPAMKEHDVRSWLLAQRRCQEVFVPHGHRSWWERVAAGVWPSGAHAMFSECVRHDPGNLPYVEALLKNFQARQGDRPKRPGGRLARPLRLAVEQQRWDDVLRLGIEALAANPWHAATLQALARACEATHRNEVELAYLKTALDANPRDPDINRHCARSLARMGQFDQAIACWHRMERHVAGAGPSPRAAHVAAIGWSSCLVRRWPRWCCSSFRGPRHGRWSLGSGTCEGS